MGEPVGIAHLRALGLAFLLVVAVSASAHEIGTTRVSATFRRDHTYVIDMTTAREGLLRRRALNPAALAKSIDVEFGATRAVPRIEVTPVDAATVKIRLTGDLPARAETFRFRYALTFASYALTVANEGETEGATQWISADEWSQPVTLSRAVIAPSRLDVMRQYLALGFTHIVPGGLDHILFVLGIFLLSMKLKPVLAQVTAFTIAHSITLGMTIYGIVSVSPRIVEPMIALSIAYVAIENLTTSELRHSRVAVVFVFGLLHGMGFAGVLKDLGLPRSEFLTALVTFNLGVELGQLAVITTAYLLFGWWAKQKPAYRRRYMMPASAAIAATGVFWTVQRIFV